MSPRQLLARGLMRFFSPFVPRNRRLGFNYSIARLAGSEPELIYLHRLGPNQGLAIDAGANEGLFAYRLSGLYSQVHAFEINPELADQLGQSVPRSVTVHAFGLSSEERRATLLTPFYNGQPLRGWASLEHDNCPAAERYEESTVLVRPLDALGLEGVSFLKADVEGHELELLAGARETLRRNRPVVLLEVKGLNLQKVRAFFSEMSYDERTLIDLVGVAGALGNYIFVPRS
jgi:FkbM family methyltransferase